MAGARLRLALVLLLWGGLTTTARADPFHHQTFPLGERALGMGGAFAGLANDPSTSFYNPAGLARLDDVVISASLALNTLDRQLVRNGFRASGAATDLEHVSRPALPVFASFVKQLGWHEGDARRHAVAFTTLTVDRRRLSFDAAIEVGEDPRRVNTLSVADERNVRWYGLSYAYRVSPALSFGLSSFLSLNSWSHAEEQLDLLLAAPDVNPNLYRDAIISVHSTRANSNVKNGVFRLGVLYAVSARLRVGAMFQPPSFRFRGRAFVRDRIVSAEAGPDNQVASYYQGQQGGLEAHDPIPWELRLGISYAPNYRLLFALDVSGYGRRGTPDDPVVAIGPREVTPGTVRTPQPGDLVSETWYGKRTGNVAWGVEYNIRDLFILRSGVYTDLSGAPAVPTVSQTFRPADVNRIGATFSFGLLARGYDLSLGVAGSVGWGKGQAWVPDDIDAPYRRTKVQEETLFVFLSGARRAMGKMAEDTYQMLKERLQSRGEDGK